MKKWQIKKYRNEMCADIFTPRNIKMNWQKCSSVKTEMKLLVARQVIHPKLKWLNEGFALL